MKAQARRGPAEFFPTELEEEFVCSMGWAAQKAAMGSEVAANYFSKGLEVEAADIGTESPRAIYCALLAVIERGEFPTWGVLRDEVRRTAPGMLPFVPSIMVYGTGLVSAIPTYVEKLKESSERRRTER